MPTSERRDRLIDESVKLTERLSAVLAELDKTDYPLPLEPGRHENTRLVRGSARFVTFVKKFNGNTAYTYVAVRPPNTGNWTMTQRNARAESMSWDKLLEFVQRDERDPRAAIASIRQLTPPTRGTGLDYEGEPVEGYPPHVDRGPAQSGGGAFYCANDPSADQGYDGPSRPVPYK